MAEFEVGDYVRDHDSDDEYKIIAKTTEGDYIVQRPTVRIGENHGYNPISIENKKEVESFFEKVEFVKCQKSK